MQELLFSFLSGRITPAIKMITLMYALFVCIYISISISTHLFKLKQSGIKRFFSTSVLGEPVLVWSVNNYQMSPTSLSLVCLGLSLNSATNSRGSFEQITACLQASVSSSINEVTQTFSDIPPASSIWEVDGNWQKLGKNLQEPWRE